MAESREEIIVGILGQWASGKSTAADTLVNYLGGENEVIFVTDRALLAGLTAAYILELDESEVDQSIDEAGCQRLAGEYAAVYLEPGEDLDSVDLNMLRFDIHDDVYDDQLAGGSNWLKRARLELGDQIRDRSGEGKPIVIEAGFGTNTEPMGKNPFSHTISDLFSCLSEAGVEPIQLRWIIVEACYETRSKRNRSRPDSVPAAEFDRFAADGGGLEPAEQCSLEKQRLFMKRVPNDHNDVQQFKADIIAAFEEMFPEFAVPTAVEGNRNRR